MNHMEDEISKSIFVANIFLNKPQFGINDQRWFYELKHQNLNQRQYMKRPQFYAAIWILIINLADIQIQNMQDHFT